MGSSGRYKNSKNKREYFRGKVTKSKDSAATNAISGKQISFNTKIEGFVEINR